MRSKIFAGLTLAAVLIGAVACSEYRDPSMNHKKGLLVKAPELYMYAGGQELTGAPTSKKSAYMNANMYNQDWQCVPNVNLTDEEMQELLGLFCKPEGTKNTVILPWKNYWVQQVYKGEAQYHPTDINGNEVSGTTITGSNQMDELVAYNENYTNNDNGYWDPELQQWIVVPHHYEHVNNFNYGNNTNNPGQCGCGIVHEGTTLMVDMSTEGITPNNQFGFHESYGTSHNYNNYIILQYKGEWYVGFDYEMHKNEAQNPNEAKHVERDWCFTDWIVKITPALHNSETTYPDPIIDEDPTPEPDPVDPVDPVDPTPDSQPLACQDHVEINFAVEEHNDYNAAHLSMHLRAATDIKVFIPVPVQYFCLQDDMYIVEKHVEESLTHGGAAKDDELTQLLEAGETSITRNINGYDVTLTIKYVENGIVITTDGMCQEVLDYLQEVYGDGLTFEVWSYFNTEITRDGLRDFFYENKATVEFLNEPCMYVNAYFDGKDGQPAYDCPVDIVKEQEADYNDPVKGLHYNGSFLNDIYVRSDLNIE